MSANRPWTHAGRSAVWIVIPLALAFSVSSVHAQSNTSVDQLAFMAGHWTRTTDGMHVEQVFLPPAAGTLVGMQRRTQGSATLVSFFFIFEETDDGIVLRFKHYENDFTTYEDRNNSGPRTFWLLETSTNTATLEERTAEGSLYLRCRVTDLGQLGVAVGSPEDFESHALTETLYDRIR